ncbi:hypothetical protein EMIHUDRAFT_454728, partial [Emiliania huxleyi CCMP1516]|uniref:Uncharacterized protein n=2 Tax=Emiliania huxleyi TaxID=2903 RepID=A0A0D3KQ41_EMIH1
MVDGGGLPFALGGLLITSSEDGGVHIRVAQHAVASDSLSHSEFTLPPPAAGWRFEAAATVLHHGFGLRLPTLCFRAEGPCRRYGVAILDVRARRLVNFRETAPWAEAAASPSVVGRGAAAAASGPPSPEREESLLLLDGPILCVAVCGGGGGGGGGPGGGDGGPVGGDGGGGGDATGDCNGHGHGHGDGPSPPSSFGSLSWLPACGVVAPGSGSGGAAAGLEPLSLTCAADESLAVRCAGAAAGGEPGAIVLGASGGLVCRLAGADAFAADDVLRCGHAQLVAWGLAGGGCGCVLVSAARCWVEASDHAPRVEADPSAAGRWQHTDAIAAALAGRADAGRAAVEAALATQRAHGLLYAHALRRIASATDRRSGEARGGRGGGGAAAAEEEEEHADIAAAIDTADASPSPLLSEWAAAERLSAVGEAEAPPPPPRATAAAAA